MLKIVHIIVGLGDGGAEASLFRLVSHERLNRHCVVSLADDGKYGPLLRSLGCEVIAIGMRAGRPSIGSFLKVLFAIGRFRPDIVQTWMYHANLVGAIVSFLFRIPVVWGIHNTELTVGVSKKRTIFVSWICACLSKLRPIPIVACAESAKEAHIKFGYLGRFIHVIPNGYDLTVFAECNTSRKFIRQQNGLAASSFVFGMVGRFDPYKDHGNLLASAQQLASKDVDFVLVLVGPGMESSNSILVNEIDRLGLASIVKLLGPRTDIPGLMNAFDVHVLSSRAEAFPNVLAEAMACGTPCVSTDVGDAGRIVGETGWVVRPRDPNALASVMLEALEEFRNQPRAWEERRRACRGRIVERFSIERIADAYATVWRNTANSKKRSE